jgi:hypothetical protein
MNLPVLQIKVLSELLLIERSKSHVLPDVRWLESAVTPLSDLVERAELMFGFVTAQPPSTRLPSCAT